MNVKSFLSDNVELELFSDDQVKLLHDYDSQNWKLEMKRKCEFMLLG